MKIRFLALVAVATLSGCSYAYVRADDRICIEEGGFGYATGPRVTEMSVTIPATSGLAVRAISTMLGPARASHSAEGRYVETSQNGVRKARGCYKGNTEYTWGFPQ